VDLAVGVPIGPREPADDFGGGVGDQQRQGAVGELPLVPRDRVGRARVEPALVGVEEEVEGGGPGEEDAGGGDVGDVPLVGVEVSALVPVEAEEPHAERGEQQGRDGDGGGRNASPGAGPRRCDHTAAF
jgi:hypothetical protein